MYQPKGYPLCDYENGDIIANVLGRGQSHPDHDEFMKHILVVDEDENRGLVMVHYETAFMRKFHDVRGIVLTDGTHGVIKEVCKSHSYPEEMVCDTDNLTAEELQGVHEYQAGLSFNRTPVLDEIEQEILDLSRYDLFSAQLAPEGTTIRVWKYRGDWLMSSHKKIDAGRSRWGGAETFGMAFDRLLHQPEIRNAEKGYRMAPNTADWDNLFSTKEGEIDVFVLTTPATRLACFTEDRLTYMYSYSVDGTTIDRLEKYTFYTESEYISISDVNFDPSFEETLELVKNIVKTQSSGVITVYWDPKVEYFRCFKVMDYRYAQALKIRNNEPNLKLRWLELWKQADPSLGWLENMFPESAETFQTLRKNVELLPNKLAEYYSIRESGQFLQLPPTEHKLLVRAVENCTQTGLHPVQSIMRELDQCSPLELNRMFNTLNAAEKLRQEEQVETKVVE